MRSILDRVTELLGDEAEPLLDYTARGFERDVLHLSGPDSVDRVLTVTDRPPAVLRNFQAILDHGRLAGTGRLNMAAAAWPPAWEPVNSQLRRPIAMPRRLRSQRLLSIASRPSSR